LAKIRCIKNEHNPDREEYVFRCPGCNDLHVINNTWTFNGDVGKPTFNPSVLVNRNKLNPAMPVCHSFIRDGKIQFLNDCTHGLAGQTVDLDDFIGGD